MLIVKFDQQPLQKSASCWREGSLGFHCLLPNAQRKVHVTRTFLCWGCEIVWFFKHLLTESETVLAMPIFLNQSSSHTESYSSWLGASESQPPRVCEIFQSAVALRLSGGEHPSNVEVISGEELLSDVEVISGEEQPSSCSGVILSLSKNRLNEVAGKWRIWEYF